MYCSEQRDENFSYPVRHYRIRVGLFQRMSPSRDDFVSRVERTICQHRLINRSDTVIVALSGGADSTALLDLLTRLPDFNLTIIAAHLNHGLRGAESDADQEFCRLLAARYAVKFEVRSVDIGAIASANRQNFEDAGRCARIAFLDEMRTAYSATAVTLAHHADDQAETVLMRLLRGSGMTGLSGMAYRNSRGYVRPFLDVNRSEIEIYLRGRDLEWREDSSNSDTSYVRNRIRHHLLPLLEEYNPAIRAGLASTALIVGGDELLLAELTEQAFASSCRIAEGSVESSVLQLRTLNPALLRRVMRYAFSRLTGTLERVGHRHIDSLCDVIDSSRPTSQLSLPHGITALREYDRLSLMKIQNPENETDYEVLIAEPGRYQLPGGITIRVELTDPTAFRTDSDSGLFDLAKTPFPWSVRTFRPGDRMVPFGMNGRKKVKDIFIDRKIPQSERRNTPLLFCNNELIWIAGVCASNLVRIHEGTRVAVKATCIRH